MGKLKPKLVIAGPGSGKTTEMVSQIISVLPELERYRHLVAITYTNSAKETIHKRLQERISIPPNITICTIHHFLNHFIVVPYATIYNLASLEKLFLEYDLDKVVSDVIKKNNENYYKYAKAARERILHSLLKSGKIPLGEIPRLAKKLIENKEVLEAVSVRLQYLFIDEFQDVDSVQAEVFHKINRAGRTKIYAVGDPEQYILSYTIRNRTKPDVSKLPINSWKADRECKTENYRSYEEIVKFTNKLQKAYEQVSKKGSACKSAVIFINSSNLNTIIPIFQQKCNEIG